MNSRHLVLIIFLAVIAACNEQPKQTVSTENKQTDSRKKKLQDSVAADKKLDDKFNQTLKAFDKTVDSLKLDKGIFPVYDFLSGNIGDDDYRYALFYLNFMTVAKAKDKAKITKMIHFPFQTTRQKVKYSKKYGDYEVAGAENWKGGLLNEKQFDAQYDKIFTDEILENIPETKPKEVTGMVPGNIKPTNDYYSQLQAFTDKGSNIYMVNIELPVSKRKYGYVFFAFGRVNGEYKILSYFLQ
ncbi:hypothetical protein [Pedobacter cryoconitis]|uniref:Lipoprotein n=1 Tax=Pedobacter cryoconitis TaxID=188932 RepID=A0A7X0J0R1_9SPHI|nr:hypothetical protein [Pedobacter cryoconitis]MBB6498959.1 hypothetical protein [Pedobacter cryoconitis]